MNFQSFAEWLFYGVLSGAAVYISYMLKQLSDSVHQLNIQLAIILTKSEVQEKRLDKVEARLDREGGYA